MANMPDWSSERIPLVGRERETDALAQLLASASVELIGLTGAPGVGKSRVAREAARSLGLPLVEMAPDQPLTVAEVIALRERADRPVVDCQARVDGVALAMLTQGCGSATGPTWLLPIADLPGAARLKIPRLDLDASRAMFLAAAEATAPGSLRGAEPIIVDEILLELDGLPLAIELCALQLAILPLESLRARLVQPLRLLDPQGQGRPRSLVASLTHAWSALDDDRRALLVAAARLGGSFGAEDLENLLPTRIAVTAMVRGLVELGWLDVTHAGGDVRLTMSALMRHFIAPGVHPRISLDRRSRLTAVLHAAETWASALRERGDDVAEGALLDAEAESLSAARTLSSLGRAEDAARLLLAIDARFEAGARPDDLDALLGSLVDHPDLTAQTRAGLLLAHADRALAAGQLNIAARACARCKDLSPELNLARRLEVLLVAARLALLGADLAATRDGLDRARALLTEAEEAAWARVARIRFRLLEGRLARHIHRSDEALEHADAAHDMAIRHRHASLIAEALDLRVCALLDRDDVAGARAALAATVGELDSGGTWRSAARLLELGGFVSLLDGDYQAALREYTEAVGLYARRSDHRASAARAGLACAWLGLGRPDEAATALGPAPPREPTAVWIEHELTTSVTEARLGRIDSARALLAHVADHTPRELEAALGFVDGIIDVEQARVAAAAGAGELAQALMARARAKRPQGGRIWPDIAWLAGHELDRLIRRFDAGGTFVGTAAPARALVVDRGGHWVQPPGNPLVSLAQRPVLRRLLAAMVADPETGLSAEDLFAAGWPGESARAASARNRVWVSVGRLRALGLGDHLAHDERGYYLRDVFVAD
jgi:tetratricopeptide (TPR) repeat protein